MSDTGIILLSIGRPVYALWAHNMLVSIRSKSRLPVTLVTDNYPQKDWHIFPDKIVEMEPQDYLNGGEVSIAKAKMNIWRYSDYEKTIYLDVDGLLLKEIDFEIEDFMIQVNGYSTIDDDNTDANVWDLPEKIYSKYGIDKSHPLPGTNSSFMAWDQRGVKVLQTALNNFDDPIPVNELRYKWGKSGQHPDELYINTALAQLGITPQQGNYLFTKKRNQAGYSGLNKIMESYVLCCWGGQNFNHHEITGTGNRKTGFYNKACIENYQEVYGEDRFEDHYFSLIKNKIYEKPILQRV